MLELLAPAGSPEAVTAAVQAGEQGYDCSKGDGNEIDEQGFAKKRNLYGAFARRDLMVGYKRLKAIREAIGDNVDIIVEAHALTDKVSAIEFGRMIEEFRIAAYEEPVMNLNPMCLKEVREHISIPIAAGERVFTRWGYRPFFENHIIDLIQPDIGTCGGMSEAKKICDMGHIYDTTCQIHVCGGPIMTAADPRTPPLRAPGRHPLHLQVRLPPRKRQVQDPRSAGHRPGTYR